MADEQGPSMRQRGAGAPEPPIPPCPRCDAGGRCTFACRPDWSAEQRERAAFLQAILAEGLADMIGKTLTPALADVIEARVKARITILDELL